MPYVVRRVTGGWKVFVQGTTRAMSKEPFKTRQEAIAQQKALYANDPSARQEGK